MLKITAKPVNTTIIFFISMICFFLLSAYTKSLSNSPNPPAPFPEREGGDISVLPSPFRGGAGGGVFYHSLIANRYYPIKLIYFLIYYQKPFVNMGISYASRNDSTIFISDALKAGSIPPANPIISEKPIAIKTILKVSVKLNASSENV